MLPLHALAKSSGGGSPGPGRALLTGGFSVGISTGSGGFTSAIFSSGSRSTTSAPLVGSCGTLPPGRSKYSRFRDATVSKSLGFGIGVVSSEKGFLHNGQCTSSGCTSKQLKHAERPQQRAMQGLSYISLHNGQRYSGGQATRFMGAAGFFFFAGLTFSRLLQIFAPSRCNTGSFWLCTGVLLTTTVMFLGRSCPSLV